MKVTSIPEVLDLPDATIVHAFKATIKKAFKRNPVTGFDEGQFGPKSYEDLLCTDGVNEIKVVLNSREPLDPKLVGKSVYFNSYQGERGWSGVKTKDSTDKAGKTRRVLWVTGTADITDAANLPDSDQEARGTPAAAREPATEQRPAPANHAPQAQSGMMDGKQALSAAKVFGARRLSLLKIATKIVCAFAREFNASPESKELGIKLSEPEFWNRVTNMVMSLEAEGLAMRRGWADVLPKDVSFATLQEVVPASKAKPATSSPANPKPEPPKRSEDGWGTALDAGHECPRCLSVNLDALGLCPACDDEIPF